MRAGSDGGSDCGCMVCGSASIEPWHSKNGYELQRCRDCGTGFIGAKDRAGLRPEDFYGEQYYVGAGGRTYADYASEKAPARRTAVRILKWIEARSRVGRLLEVGAAAGFFVAAARARGWDANGVDISEYAGRMAGDVSNVNVKVGDFLSDELDLEIEERSLRAVVGLDTIEHMADPAGMVRRASALLEDGGIMVLSTGDAGSLMAGLSGRRWRLLEPPEHQFYFTRESMRRLLERFGMETLEFRNLWRSYTLKSLGASMNVKMPSWSSGLFLPVNLFDVFYVMARKS